MRGSLRDPSPKNNDPQSAVVRIALRGAASSPSIEGVDRLPAKSNYFIGNDPNRWRTEVPNYARIELKNVYPGIDLIYHGVERGQLEYDFRLAPGADPKLVRLSFKGGKRLALDRDGNLVVSVGNSKLIERAPVIYQGDGGERRTVAGRWVLRGADTAGFRLARYDRRRPIVIDPVLVYSSYLGGSGGDSGHGIAVDSFGDAYVTGITSRPIFRLPRAYSRPATKARRKVPATPSCRSSTPRSKAPHHWFIRRTWAAAATRAWATMAWHSRRFVGQRLCGWNDVLEQFSDYLGRIPDHQQWRRTRHRSRICDGAEFDWYGAD